MDHPNRIWVTTSKGVFGLAKKGDTWEGHGVRITTNDQGTIALDASDDPIYQIEATYNHGIPEGAMVMGDDWERSYGTLHWGEYDYSRVLPWYFAAHHDHQTTCWGVNTGCRALAYWRAGVEMVRLILDVRSGCRPLLLTGRSIELATVYRFEGGDPHPTLHTFLKTLCPKPRLADKPVYGANDWYYAYGNNTAKVILEDSKRVSDLSESPNRPFSVIDDGWQLPPGTTGGQWTGGNERFGDMPGLAHKMKELGCRPGIWMRPLYSAETHPESWFMAKDTLDPSNKDVLGKVFDDVHRLHVWGYELIKHDYSTFDVTSQWGFSFTDGMGSKGRTFADQSRTTAEILLDFYQTIRRAAGDSLIIGCNTVGHLTAGLFELQRTGDDTSGREWPRTVKMGVNTLAFRGVQEGAFFGADADCVGITTDVPWEKTKMWLELVSRSGTPLFVSAQQKAVGPDQLSALRDAFSIAAINTRLGEPIDWMTNRQPQKWNLGGVPVNFDWWG
ncbi:MAG: hypothetical protein JST51_14925 [Armatimonadetes bacterium]|nr:hypothetical protein [Armatimonadota bacterium]